MMRLLQALRAQWADTMHEKATQLRERAECEHQLWITLLMAQCDHALLIDNPYRPVEWTANAPAIRDFCWRCAGIDSVPGYSGARLRLLLKLADLYDAIAGVRRPT